MINKIKISHINDVKNFMQKIEPQLENLLKSFYQLKKIADDKSETINLLLKLETLFSELNNTTNRYDSEDYYINKFIGTIAKMTKRDVIHRMRIHQMNDKDFFEIMKHSHFENNRFDYECWGIMNQRVLQLYLNIYTSYSKCIYELLKREI